MDQAAEIRSFLTSRRARITPEQAGIPTFGGARRVPGLRREELAHAAGVSVDYLTRLERGKVRGASAEVLDAIARVLQLDAVEREHLHDLFRATRSARPGSRTRRPSAGRKIRPGLQSVLDTMTVPALVQDQRNNMVAANHLARAIYPHAAETGASPFNQARFLFLDPRAQEFYVDWELATRNTVALLRVAAGHDPHDEELIRLVGALSTQSEVFRTLWAGHDVIRYQQGTKRYRHPLVGELTFGYESFGIPTDPGLTMLVYTVEAGSPTQDALRILGSWTSGDRVEPHDDRSPASADAADGLPS